jgi:hypothetical protein
MSLPSVSADKHPSGALHTMVLSDGLEKRAHGIFGSTILGSTILGSTTFLGANMTSLPVTPGPQS